MMVSLHSTGHSVPGEFARYLRDYQRDGIQFLYSCFAAGHGALLGDDMGLGKTIQVIGLLVAVLKLKARMDAKPEFLLKKGEKHRCYEGTALIVVPPAVLLNWKKELDTWGHFRIGCIEKAAERTRILEQVEAKQLDVVLATYTGVRTHLDDYLYASKHIKQCTS